MKFMILLLIAALMFGCVEYPDKHIPSKVAGYHWSPVYKGEALIRDSDGLIVGETNNVELIGGCYGGVSGLLQDHEYIDCDHAKRAMEAAVIARTGF